MCDFLSSINIILANMDFFPKLDLYFFLNFFKNIPDDFNYQLDKLAASAVRVKRTNFNAF